jgi:hypothetical protein
MAIDISMATAKKRKGPGRPPLPPGVAKDTVVRFMASSSEIELMNMVAARHGLVRSEVIRRALKLLEMYPGLMPPKPKPYVYDPSKHLTDEEYYQRALQKAREEDER